MPRLCAMNKITCVIDEAGGVSALAAELHVKPPTVHQWKNGDRKVSPRLAIAISQKWPKLVTVHDLRPDIFGEAPAEQKRAG